MQMLLYQNFGISRHIYKYYLRLIYKSNTVFEIFVHRALIFMVDHFKDDMLS